MAALNACEQMMANWGLPARVPEEALTVMNASAQMIVAKQYSGFCATLATRYAKPRGAAIPHADTIAGLPVALPANFAANLAPEDYLTVQIAYLSMLRKYLEQRRIDLARHARDEARGEREAALAPEDEAALEPDEAAAEVVPPPAHESDFDDDGPSASSDSEDREDEEGDVPAPAVLAPDAVDAPAKRRRIDAPAPPVRVPAVLPPAVRAPAPVVHAPAPAPPPAPVPRVHAPAPVPAPAPDPVAAMLERLVPDGITAFVQRLERTKRKQDADPVCFLLNDLLGANYISMNNIPKVVRARFATAMTDNGFDLKAVGVIGMHYRSRQFPNEVIRLQRQADRPTDFFC